MSARASATHEARIMTIQNATITKSMIDISNFRHSTSFATNPRTDGEDFGSLKLFDGIEDRLERAIV